MDTKLDRLKTALARTEGVLVAFSAGVDSTFLLRIACAVLRDRAIALTAISPTIPAEEVEAAKNFARDFQCRHIIVDSHELTNPAYSHNPVNRCFFCKDELYRICRAQADLLGIVTVVDGTNVDDLGDHRPGLAAAEQWGVRHPLVEADMTKNDIRQYSQELRLPTWNKPSTPCLSSRFPYGTEINLERLNQVGACERFLRELRFREFRVRYHGDLARIEASPAEFDRWLDAGVRDAVVARFKEMGFKYISLDLQGYRTGSMNEGLRKTPL